MKSVPLCQLKTQCNEAHLRGGDDDFGVFELLVKLGIFVVLVSSADKCVSLFLNPLSEAELVFNTSQEFGLILGVLAALVRKNHVAISKV
jgi:hypothetical protein